MADRLPDDLLVVNCASCEALLSAEPERLCGLPGVGGRIKHRPYCAGGMATDHGSPSPWLEGTTRAQEDGPCG